MCKAKRVCDGEDCNEEVAFKKLHRIVKDKKKIYLCNNCYSKNREEFRNKILEQNPEVKRELLDLTNKEARDYREKLKGSPLRSYTRGKISPLVVCPALSPSPEIKLEKETRRPRSKKKSKSYTQFSLTLAEKQYLFRKKLNEGLDRIEADEFVYNLNQELIQFGKELRKKNKDDEKKQIEELQSKREDFLRGLGLI